MTTEFTPELTAAIAAAQAAHDAYAAALAAYSDDAERYNDVYFVNRYADALTANAAATRVTARALLDAAYVAFNAADAAHAAAERAALDATLDADARLTLNCAIADLYWEMRQAAADLADAAASFHTALIS